MSCGYTAVECPQAAGYYTGIPISIPHKDLVPYMMDSFANQGPPQPRAEKSPHKKGKTMNNFANVVSYEETAPTDQIQRAYLIQQLDHAYRNLLSKARMQFGLTQDDAPKTAKELIQRIKDGKVTIPEEKNDKKCGYVWDVFSRIKWQDPSKVEDQDGYDKFEESLTTAKTSAERTISIKSPDEGLAAVIAFETTPIA